VDFRGEGGGKDLIENHGETRTRGLQRTVRTQGGTGKATLIGTGGGYLRGVR